MVLYGILWYSMGNTSKMSNFLKNRVFAKISILLSFCIILLLFLFINENLKRKFALNNINNDFLSKKLFKNYNNFFEIEKITLNGRTKSNLDSIKNIINSELYETKNIIRFDVLNVKNALNELKWINEVNIRKALPNKIDINIKEHEEYAIFIKKNKNFLISNEGKIIYEIKNPDAYELIYLEGEQSLKKIDQIKQFLNTNSEIKKSISKITVFSNDRWDLRLNGILFKLPSENKNNVVLEIKKFVDIKNIKMVDLRFFEEKVFIKMDKKTFAMKNKK